MADHFLIHLIDEYSASNSEQQNSFEVNFHIREWILNQNLNVKFEVEVLIN